MISFLVCWELLNLLLIMLWLFLIIDNKVPNSYSSYFSFTKLSAGFSACFCQCMPTEVFANVCQLARFKVSDMYIAFMSLVCIEGFLIAEISSGIANPAWDTYTIIGTHRATTAPHCYMFIHCSFCRWRKRQKQPTRRIIHSTCYSSATHRMACWLFKCCQLPFGISSASELHNRACFK